MFCRSNLMLAVISNETGHFSHKNLKCFIVCVGWYLGESGSKVFDGKEHRGFVLISHNFISSSQWAIM